LVLEEQKRGMEFTKEAYFASLSLKAIRVWRFIKNWLLESDIIRVWSSSESEVKKLESVIIGYLQMQVCRRNKSLEQRLFQRNLKAFDAYPLKSAGKRHSTIAQPLLHYSTTMSTHSSAIIVSLLVMSLNKEWILNYSLIGH